VIGQAVAELHLGRFPEAEAALSAALQKYPNYAELLANAIVLSVLSGKDASELMSYVSLPLSGLEKHFPDNAGNFNLKAEN
jgi:coatomer subunit epsilon